MSFFFRHTPLLLAGMIALSFPALALAGEKVNEKSTAPTSAAPTSARFAPDFCDFEVTFPEPPTRAKKCIPDQSCYDVYSYTMVYDLRTTVDISVNCTPSTPETYKRYDEKVMRTALAGLASGKNLSEKTMRFQQLEGARTASLAGTGVSGTEDKIYTAQIWAGPHSVFTVQAELIGAAHPEADKSFSKILSSIGLKKAPSPAPVSTPTSGKAPDS